MDRWFLIAATLLAAVAGVRGLMILRHGNKSRWTIWWMVGVMLCQMGYLALRGEMRGACPLRSSAEISVFLAWSLTLFYLLVGPVYRISLLGVFTAPVVVIFQGFALLPGRLAANTDKIFNTSFWGETHSAMLDHQLKEHHLKGGLFRNLPPVPELLVSLERLLWLGMILLTVGVIAGLFMPAGKGAMGHLFAAVGVWAGYVILMVTKRVRGITGRRFALGAVVLFVLSLGVFAFV